MTFQKEEIQTLLSDYADEIVKFFGKDFNRPFHTFLNPKHMNAVQNASFNAPTLYDWDLSHHQQIKREQFFVIARRKFKLIESWFRKTYPALDLDFFKLYICITPLGKYNAFEISFDAKHLTAKRAKLITIIDRLETLHERISHLPPPSRKFMINGELFHAADPNSALRCFIALLIPNLFIHPKKRTDYTFTVSEVITVDLDDALSDT